MTTYKDSGVDIDAANEGLKRIKKHVQSTYNEHTLSDIGSFGGCFNLSLKEYENPTLVSSVDGVGTKLLLADLASKYDTIGQCLVNHCTNDILVLGAKPLFFLDYFAAGKLNNDILEDVIKGFSIACKENNCVLIGGETAEMPGFYDDNKFDLSGTIVGIVDRNKMLSNRTVSEEDILIGLNSNGLHTNGYSLARNVLIPKYEIGKIVPSLGISIDQELLKVHRSYLSVLERILEKPWLKALSHITGGGIIENTLRVIDPAYDLEVNWNSWKWPEIYNLIKKEGNVPKEDMIRTFNLGIGMVLIVDKNNLEDITLHLNKKNEKFTVMGKIIRK